MHLVISVLSQLGRTTLTVWFGSNQPLVKQKRFEPAIPEKNGVGFELLSPAEAKRESPRFFQPNTNLPAWRLSGTTDCCTIMYAHKRTLTSALWRGFLE
jgi:hypothetical protein